MSVYRRRVMQVKHPPNQITAVYNVTSTTKATNLLGASNIGWVDSIFIDGEKTQIAKKHVFSVTGQHEVKFVIKNLANIDGSYMFADISNMTSVDFSECRTPITNANRLFFSCSALKEVKGLILNKPDDVQYMFYGCKLLTSLECSKWDLSTAKRFDYMFRQCSALEHLDASNWGLNEATNVSYMFQMCPKLKTIGDTSRWDLRKATTCKYMFYECKALEQLDTSNWGLNSVTNTSQMFDTCKQLTTLGDTSGWDLSNVTDSSAMFQGCNVLEELDVSNWLLTQTTTCKNMFYMCYQLQLSGTENLSLKEVQAMTGAFNYCYKLKKLNLLKCDFSKVTDFTYMLTNCPALEELSLNTEISSSATPGTNTFTYNTSSGIEGAILYYYPHASFVEKFLPILPSKWTAIDITTLE